MRGLGTVSDEARSSPHLPLPLTLTPISYYFIGSAAAGVRSAWPRPLEHAMGCGRGARCTPLKAEINFERSGAKGYESWRANLNFIWQSEETLGLTTEASVRTRGGLNLKFWFQVEGFGFRVSAASQAGPQRGVRLHALEPNFRVAES
eukprot:3582449-Rhodomonas_salina.1